MIGCSFTSFESSPLPTLGSVSASTTTTGHSRLYHWTVPELIAHEALHEWWAQTLTWPLGWWPWENGPTPPALPDHLASEPS